MKKLHLLALALPLLACSLIYGFYHLSFQHQHYPSGGPVIGIPIYISGLEEGDRADVATARKEGIGWIGLGVTNCGNGYRDAKIGCAMERPTMNGVYLVTARAEGYTVEPGSYEVELKEGRLVDPDQVLNFVFQKVS